MMPWRVWLFGLASWLAYGALVPLYEWVARWYSDGEWHTWRRQAVGPLQAMTLAAAKQGRRAHVLEVGCGTGALLAELALQCQVIGLDRSAGMLVAAQRRVRQHRAAVALVQGQVEALPLPDGLFDAIVMTFPTDYAFATAAWHEFARTLTPDGQIIWIDAGELRRPSPLARRLQALLLPTAALTGYVDRITQRLRDLGFTVTLQTVELPRSRVRVLLARPDRPGAAPEPQC